MTAWLTSPSARSSSTERPSSCRAIAQFVEQPYVLDGDDSLFRKVADQFDLLVGERADLLAVDDKSTDQLVILEHRHRDGGSRAAEFGRRGWKLDRRAVGHVGHLFRLQHAVEHGSRRRRRQDSAVPLQKLGKWRGQIEHRRHFELALIGTEHDAEFGLANAQGILQHGLEHGFKFTRRARDDAQDLRGRSLLLQRFPQLVEQPRILDSDYRLLGEVRDQLDLPVGERPHLFAVDRNNANQFTFFKHRHAEDRSCTTDVGKHPRGFNAAKVSRFVSEVGDVHRLFCPRHPF